MNTLQSMFAHLHWADRRILTALQNLNGDCGEARRYFSHILLAEQIWFTRLQEKDSSHLTVWSELDVTALSRLIEQNHEMIAAYLSGLREERLDTPLSYKNQSGNAYQTSIRDILTHVALHGQYHRGQINTVLRREGHTPVSVDYILFVREK